MQLALLEGLSQRLARPQHLLLADELVQRARPYAIGQRPERVIGRRPEDLPADAPRLPGEVAFRLHDTYGFPVDLTAELAAEHGVAIDRAGFDAALAEQRERSRSGKKAELAKSETVQSKPEDIRPKIVEGQLKKWYAEVSLYDQPFRDEDRTVRELITEAVATIGENIRVRRFARYALGEEL